MEATKEAATNLFAFKQSRKKLKAAFRVEKKIENLYTGGSIEISKDEKFLASLCGNQIKIIDCETGAVTRCIESEDETISAFAISPDSKKLVSASINLQLRYWDLETGTCIRTWKGHDAPIICLCFETTGTLIASGSADKTIKVYDVEKGYFTHSFRGHSGIITALKFHPDSYRLQLVSGSEDNSVRVWDLVSNNCKILSDHMSQVTAIDFSKSGWELVTASRDKVVIVWNMRTFAKQKTIPVYDPIESIQLHFGKLDFVQQTDYNPKEGYVFAAGEKGIIKVFELITGTCVFEESRVEGLKYSITHLLRTSKDIITVTSDHNIIFSSLNDFSRHKFLVGFNDEVIDVKYISDSNIAVATNSEQIRLFNTLDRTCNVLSGHSDIVLSIDVNSKKTMMLSASKDTTIKLWNLNGTSAECIATGIGHTEAVSGVSFGNKNDHMIVSVSQDKTIKLWELSGNDSKTLKVKFTEKAHDKDINAIAVSPNDKLFATASQDKTIKLWNSKDLSLVSTLRGHRRGVWSVEFSTVEQCLVSSSSDKTIKIWSVSDFTCLKTLEGHANSVLKVSFITNGTQLLSCGSDGLMCVWTIKTSECVGTFDSHTDKIWALAISPDESEVITGGSDSVINLWKDFTTEDEQVLLQANESRILQEQELSNSLAHKNYRKALEIAFALEQPRRIFLIFEELLSQNNHEQDAIVSDLVSAFSKERLETCFRYISTWNTNAKHSLVAQKVLKTILSCFPPSKLEEVPRVKELLEGILPYSDRHFQRIDKLIQKSFIIDFTLQKIDPTLAGDLEFPLDQVVKKRKITK